MIHLNRLSAKKEKKEVSIMSVRNKLYLGLGSVVALAIIVQIILLINLASVKFSLTQFSEVQVVSLQLAITSASKMRY